MPPVPGNRQATRKPRSGSVAMVARMGTCGHYLLKDGALPATEAVTLRIDTASPVRSVAFTPPLATKERTSQVVGDGPGGDIRNFCRASRTPWVELLRLDVRRLDD